MAQSAALFGGPAKQPKPKHLLQFKAGKMTLKTDNWVHADPRKGWCYIYQAGDSSVHFCWIDRRTCLVEDNFVLTPKQAEFKRISECTSGRVYALKGKGTSDFFVWMQEPNSKNDDDICSKINQFINSPPLVQSHSSMSSPFRGIDVAHSANWLESIPPLSGISQTDLLALIAMGVDLGSALSSESDVSSAQATAVTISRQLNTGHIEAQPTSVMSTTTTTTNVVGSTNRSAPPSASKPRIQLQDLESILANVAATTSTPSPTVDLNDVLNIDSLRSFLEKPSVCDRVAPHLPDPESQNTDTASNPVKNVQSSQFKATLKSFSNAFPTGELAPVLAQFNLGTKANEAAQSGDISAFVEALEGGPEDVNVTTHATAVASSTIVAPAATSTSSEGKMKLPPLESPMQDIPEPIKPAASKQQEEHPDEVTHKHGDSQGPEQMDTD